MRIVEGVTGLCLYHLAADDSQSALCGETKVKERLIPLAHWEKAIQDFPDWICKACDRISKESQS